MITNADEQYFEWMYSTVMEGQKTRSNYRRLLSLLHRTRFEAVLPLDSNRATDGVDLRYRFGREAGVADSFVASEIDIQDCSMLEMMVALSIRIEEHIMGNDDIGDRTGKWFFAMISSLGFSRFTDARWTRTLEAKACDILDVFSRNGYASNGQGGLFYVPFTSKDFRKTEIWYQMCEYLRDIV